MPKLSGIKFMRGFVEEYLRGDMDRMDFDLDFCYYLNQHAAKMEREYPELIECFFYYIVEQGMNQADHLGDAEHKKLIRKQWDEVKSAMQDGL
jgi:hypothetical protein